MDDFINVPLGKRPDVDLGPETEETTECAICLDVGLMCSLPCNHKYHRHCIKQWLEQNDTCPICRGDVRAACTKED